MGGVPIPKWDPTTRGMEQKPQRNPLGAERNGGLGDPEHAQRHIGQALLDARVHQPARHAGGVELHVAGLLRALIRTLWRLARGGYSANQKNV